MLTTLLSFHIVTCLYVLCSILLLEVGGIEFIPEAFQSFTFGGTTGDDAGTAVAVDQIGNIYVAGTTSSKSEREFGDLYVPVVRNSDPADKQVQGTARKLKISFTKGTTAPSEENTPPVDDISEQSTEQKVDENSTDAFIAKFNPDGSTDWVRRFGSEKMDTVTSIVYQHGKIYVAGRTFGSADSKDTPEGTGDLLLMAFKEDGSPSWNHPLQYGSGGQDSIESLAIDGRSFLDGHAVCTYLYIAGRVGGSIFRPAQQLTKDEDECGCRGSNSGKESSHSLHEQSVPVATHSSKNANSSSFISSQHLQSPQVSRESGTTPIQGNSSASSSIPEKKTPSELVDSSDLFVAKVNPVDGSIVDAVQIPLQFDNSADSIKVFGGKVYASVNSYSNNSMETRRTSALLIFCAEDLSYRTVYPAANFTNTGEQVQAMDIDNIGDVYLGGQCLTENSRSTSFFLRKYSSKAKSYSWETKLGTEVNPMVRSKLSIAFGEQNNQVYVTGHSLGFFHESSDTNQALLSERLPDPKLDKIRQETLGESGLDLPNGLVRMGLTILSSKTGDELITWDKLISFPRGFENIQSMALDQYENVIFTGKRLGAGKDGCRWAACLGSFGSQHFSMSAIARANIQSSSQGKPGGGGVGGGADRSSSSTGKKGLGTLIIGLVVMAASISLMSVAAVFVMTRSFLLEQRHPQGPGEGGFTYEYQSGELSKYEQNSQRAFVADGSEVLYGERNFSSGSGIIRRTVSGESRDRPGGSAAPA